MTSKTTFHDRAPVLAKIAQAKADMIAAAPKRALSLQTMDSIALMWTENQRGDYQRLSDQLRVALYCRALKGLEWAETYRRTITDAPLPDVLPETPMLFDDGVAILKMMANGNTGFQSLLQHIKSAELNEAMLIAEPLALTDLRLQMSQGNERAAANILKFATDLRRARAGEAKAAEAVSHTTNNVVMVTTDEKGVMRLEPPRQPVIDATVVENEPA